MSHTQFSKLTLITCLTLGLNLSACHHEKDKETNTPPVDVISPLVGVWQAPAYGLVLDLQNNSHQFYQVTSESCQRFELDLDHDEFVSSIVLSDDVSSMVTTLSGLKDPGIKLDKENSLPDFCMNNLTANKGEANYQFDAQRDFEIFWQTFSQHYAFFDIEGVDWDEVFQLANSQISLQTTEAELVEILIEMVEPLQDFHVNVINQDLNVFYSVDRKTSLEDIALQEFMFAEQVELPLEQEQLVAFEIYLENAFQQSFDAIIKYFVIDSDIKANDNETLLWGRFDNNIGYLNVTTMDIEELGESDNSIEQNKAILTATLDEIMQDFANVDGIIIDVRYNGGGDDFVSRMITSRFIDQSLHVYSKQARLGDSRTPLQQVFIQPEGSTQFLGPVAVMTSSSTSSAAEIFAMSMRQRANTVLIGEASGGGLSDILPKSLPHGTQYSLSNEFYLTPDNESFEGVGVPVDIEQAFFTSTQREQEIDLGLEQALQWINNQ